MTRIGILRLLCLALCAPVPAAGETEAPLDGEATPRLEARGPGAAFASIEAAAIDVLTYAHLQARAAGPGHN
jgi:hypothetical protein